MADANLFPDEAGFTPRPAWQVIEAARRLYLTGELKLSTNPATRIYLRDGMVYFAERASDGALAIRLMMEGVITREQMQRGTVIVNGVEHVGRMFDSDPTIDRASVELCTELFTDDVLVSVADVTINRYEMSLYRRHPSGIDRWYPHTVPVAGRQADQPVAPTIRMSEPAAAPKVAPKQKPKVEVQTQVQPQTQPQAQAQPQSQVKAAPQNNLNAPPITQAVPVTAPSPAPATASASVPPPPPTAQIPVTSPPTGQMPVTMPAPTAQIPVTPPPAAADQVDATAIADEVAEAIKRAFAGMSA